VVKKEGGYIRFPSSRSWLGASQVAYRKKVTTLSQEKYIEVKAIHSSYSI
jgi:hypothetical protein